MAKVHKAVKESQVEFRLVQKWLKKTIKIELLCSCLILIGLGFLEVALLAITGWFIYFALLFCYLTVESVLKLFGVGFLGLYHHLLLPISTSIAMLLVFVSFFKNGEVDFSDIPRIRMTSNPTSPNVWLAAAKIITSCLYSAPRLFVSISNLVAKLYRLRRLDINSCSKILVFIATSDHALTYREIFQRIENLNPVIVFPQLRDIEGVLLLLDVGKLTITPDLRAEIRSVLSILQNGNEEFDQRRDDDFEHFDGGEMRNYQILGVHPTVSDTELKSVYRELMKANHPDLVSKVGQEELRSLAEERTKQINQAYHAILAARGKISSSAN